jgi:hypothetical protein
MAAGDPSQIFIQKFAADTIHLAQQKKSKLRACVTEQFDVANKFTFKVTSGRAAMTSRATASSSTIGLNGYKRTATQFVDQVYNNRVVLPVEYVAADSYTEADVKRQLESPQATLAKAFASQVGRQFDDIIIAAAFAAALDSLGNSNSHPAGSQLGGATTAPSVDLVKTAREMLAESDVDPDEEKYMVVSPNFITALLGTTQVASKDYAPVQALYEGKVDTFCGFKFIESNRLTSPGGTPKQIYGIAMTKDAIGLAVNSELRVDIGKDPGLSFDTVVQVAIDAGAVRVQDAKCLRVHYLETN